MVLHQIVGTSAYIPISIHYFVLCFCIYSCRLNEAAISAFGDGDKYTKEEEGKEEVMNNQFPEPEVDEMRAQRYSQSVKCTCCLS
jgi:hypothetical protein